MSLGLYLISAFIGAEISYIIILIFRFINLSLNGIQIAFLFLLVIITSIIIFLVIQLITYTKIIKILIEEKDLNRFKNKCENEFKFSINNVLKIKLSIVLCEAYIKQAEFKLALKLIKSVNSNKSFKDFNSYFLLSKNIKLEFYLKLILLNVQLNNIIDAQMAFENGREIIEKFKNVKEYLFDIAYTLGLLEYAKGNYLQANELLNYALDEIDNNLDANGVSVNEGAIQFTLILGENSAANDFVKPSNAPFDAETEAWNGIP